jgi:hypothetical protein
VTGVTGVHGQVKVRVGAVKVFGVQAAESQRGCRQGAFWLLHLTAA